MEAFLPRRLPVAGLHWQLVDEEGIFIPALSREELLDARLAEIAVG
jgi:hypothetical protein